MSTIGHPLSDLSNMMTPFHLASTPDYPSMAGFLPGATPGLPTADQLIKWYAEVGTWDPAPDVTWGLAFHFFRATCIYQGIAARYAMRQASSAQAKANGELRHIMARTAWERVQLARGKGKEKEKARL